MNYKEVFQLAQEKGCPDWMHKQYDVSLYEYEMEHNNVLLLQLTLIQKWLRDEHNIQIIITASGKAEEMRYHFIAPVAYLPNKARMDVIRKDSYEQTLLEGIGETLKLLP